MEAFFCNSTTEKESRLYAFEPLAKAALFLLAGTIATLFQSTLAFALLPIGLAMICGSIAMRMYTKGHEEAAINFGLKVIHFDSEWPSVPTGILMVTLAANMIFPPLSALLGMVLGGYASILIHAKQCQRLQTTTQASSLSYF